VRTRRIRLSGGKARGRYTFVSSCDYASLRNYRWCLCNGYVCRNGGKKQVKMHRQILGLSNPKVQCDHVNGNPLDNRRDNLRAATNQENCWNRHRPQSRNKSTGILGVEKLTHGTFRAHIKRGVIVLKKTFKTLEAACAQRKQWEVYYLKG
jgi:hypothetical protein